MKFGVVQTDRFNAIGGSYSIVTEREWRNHNSAYRDDNGKIEAASDGLPELDSAAEPGVKVKRRKRDRELVEKRLRLSKYKCEFDASHKLFIARATGCPYLEVHHVVPLMYEAHYKEKRLDSLGNMCCLCPNCHRAVHHASEDYTREILSELSRKRSIQRHFGIADEELFRLYSVETILRN